MKNAFVQFAMVLHKFYAEQPRESVEADAVLSHVYEESHNGSELRVTDLVRAERFGTLPTVNRRLREMMARGLIEMVPGTDRRTRIVCVSAKGEQMLENRAALLREAAASVARRQRPAEGP